MNAFDLDHPLRVDNCDGCGAIHWRDCVCSPTEERALPSPTPAAVEAARDARATRAERDR